MDWDMNIDEDFPQDVHATMPEERTLVPAGTHVATIKLAEEGPNQWKVCDENPDGICLKLRLAIGDHKFVFHDIPKHMARMAKQLAEALGVQPENGTLRIVPADVEGREVNVEIVHYTSKAGKLSAVVKKYLPATAKPAAVAAPPAKRQTLPQKAAAVFKAAAGADDIPFAWLMAVVASVIGGGA
jgi:hypothetical protein